MYAAIILLDLGRSASLLDRGRCGRSLAAVLDGVDGFVAFIAFEAEEGALAGLCICLDMEALDAALLAADDWRRGCPLGDGGRAAPAMQPLITGEVIAQRGF